MQEYIFTCRYLVVDPEKLKAKATEMVGISVTMMDEREMLRYVAPRIGKLCELWEAGIWVLGKTLAPLGEPHGTQPAIAGQSGAVLQQQHLAERLGLAQDRDAAGMNSDVQAPEGSWRERAKRMK